MVQHLLLFFVGCIYQSIQRRSEYSMFQKGAKDFLSGTFFFLLGLFLVVLSILHPIWTKYGPGEGFFPLAVGIIIIGSSLILMIRQFRVFIHEVRKGRETEQHEKKVTDLLRVCSYIILVVLYGLSIESIGFLIGTVLFVFLILKVIERQSLKTAVFSTLVVTIASYVLFVYFLGVRLPKGLIKWW
jgi:putative tricarboxylic transport membrane protein